MKKSRTGIGPDSDDRKFFIEMRRRIRASERDPGMPKKLKKKPSPPKKKSTPKKSTTPKKKSKTPPKKPSPPKPTLNWEPAYFYSGGISNNTENNL